MVPVCTTVGKALSVPIGAAGIRVVWAKAGAHASKQTAHEVAVRKTKGWGFITDWLVLRSGWFSWRIARDTGASERAIDSVSQSRKPRCGRMKLRFSV